MKRTRSGDFLISEIENLCIKKDRKRQREDEILKNIFLEKTQRIEIERTRIMQTEKKHKIETQQDIEIKIQEGIRKKEKLQKIHDNMYL